MEKPQYWNIYKIATFEVLSLACCVLWMWKLDTGKYRRRQNKIIRNERIQTHWNTLRVTWTDKKTNDWVLKKAGTEPFFATVGQEKKAFLLWSCSMERRKLHGERNNARYYSTSGQRRRGRPRTRRQDNITKWTGLTGDRLMRSVEDRRQWRKILHEVEKPWIEGGCRYKVLFWCAM